MAGETSRVKARDCLRGNVVILDGKRAFVTYNGSAGIQREIGVREIAEDGVMSSKVTSFYVKSDYELTVEKP